MATTTRSVLGGARSRHARNAPRGRARQVVVHDEAHVEGHPEGALGHDDRRAVQRCRGGRAGVRRQRGEVAAVILEPVMMNIGIVVPQYGYLQALRDACEKHGAALIYDEVKCGGTIAYGGTHRALRRPAAPGRVGEGRRRRRHDRRLRRRGALMDWVTKGAAQQGTFNGNPLSAAAGLAGAHRGPHEGRVRPSRQARHAAGRGLQPLDRRHTTSRRTRSTSGRRAASSTARSR